MIPSIFKFYLFTIMFIYTLLSSIGFSYANEWDINYRDQLGATRFQGSLQLCTSYAVADALTLYTGQVIGAHSVAFRYYEKKSGFIENLINPFSRGFSNISLSVGLTSNVLKISANSTICKSSMERENFDINKYHLLSDEELLLTRNVWDSDYINLIKTYNDYRSYYGPEEPMKLKSKFIKAAHYIFPQLPIHQLHSSLSRKFSVTQVIGQWIDKSCKVKIGEHAPYDIVGSHFNFLDRTLDKNIHLKLIDNALEVGSLPIINYSPRFLYDKSPYLYEKVIGSHVSTIVARKLVNNKKFYLLRNSHGDDCKIKSPKLLEQCNDGHFWITPQQILENVTDVIYIKKI